MREPAVNTTSLAKTITLSNKGHATVSITGTTIVGVNAGEFSETNTCGTSVASVELFEVQDRLCRG